jgi:DnaJ-class molecular chaperone
MTLPIKKIGGKMNNYERAVKALNDKKCPVCRGLGKCDDADLGDIYYNEWTCKACAGTGIKKGKQRTK